MSLAEKLLDVNMSSFAPGNREVSWQERRSHLREWLRDNSPEDVPGEEIEAHFASMPSHYWESVTESDLVWSLKTIHAFFEVIAQPNTPATTPFMDWRTAPQSNTARVMLCTWERQGLLAKAAAAFSALKLNICQAEVYTRSDDVVLDVFHISEADGRTPITSRHKEEVTFLLAGALSEPPRFASVWACSRHRHLTQTTQAPPRVAFDNESAAESTVVQIETHDRVGLLYDILQSLTELSLNIKQARVHTADGVAKDSLHVVNRDGGKIIDSDRLNEIRARIESSVT